MVNCGRSPNDVDFSFWAGKNIQKTLPNIRIVLFSEDTRHFWVCSGGRCVSVSVRDVELHDGEWVFVSVSVVFAFHS